MALKQAPNWLSEDGKAYFDKLIRLLPARLNCLQHDLIALMADSHETWHYAREELADYARENKTLVFQNKPHPALVIQRQALANYLTVSKALQASLGKQEQEIDGLDDFLKESE